MPFREIELIKQSEEQALERIKLAETKAEEKIRIANERAGELIKREEMRAGHEAEQIVAEALDNAESEAKRIAASADIMVTRIRSQVIENSDSAVDYIVKKVTGEK